MNNLIFSEYGNTLTDMNSTWEDVVEAGDLPMKLLTDGNDGDTLAVEHYK